MARGARTPRALSIAGSDSGGGAGIQADLKAFARCGVHGMTAITALTAQNTIGVDAVHTVPPDMILAQVRAVISDIGVDAVKVGMLGSVETVHAVAQALDELPPGTPVVVDPVMVSETGARLLDVDAQAALIGEILPRATVATPNLPEALALADAAGTLPTGLKATVAVGPTGALAGSDAPNAALSATAADVAALAKAVRDLGPAVVVITGGHRDAASDLYCDRRVTLLLPGERHLDGAAHGSGCTHSSVLAAQLALGQTPLQAARVARELAGEAVASGLRDIGTGVGPVDVLGLAGLR